MSRVIRLLGDDNLAALEHSYAEWEKMEKLSEQRLLVKTGLINLGMPDDTYLDKYMQVVRTSGYACERLDPQELQRRFPEISYPGLGAVSDPSGSILLAHTCVMAVQKEFLRLGGRIVNARVEAVHPCKGSNGSDAVRVKACFLGGGTEERDFKKVAVCAGPWTRKLLPQCAHLLWSQSIPVTYWRESRPLGQKEFKHSAAVGFPVIFNARMKNIYAIPSYEYPGLVKVLVHSAPEADPDDRDKTDLQPTVDYTCQYIKEHLPLLDFLQPVIQETCMYTMTPDSKPLIDLCAPDIAVGTGYSGSGFKHSPASGKMIAALLLGTTDSLPKGFNLQQFRIARFEEGAAHSLDDSGRFVHPDGKI
jgi:sarcosine oxidase/L-pipecolate oxidase